MGDAGGGGGGGGEVWLVFGTDNVAGKIEDRLKTPTAGARSKAVSNRKLVR